MMTEGPTRTCVGCGTRGAQASMVRLRLRQHEQAEQAERDVSGEAHIVPASASPSGRSAYVHDRAICISGIVRSKGLAKSLRVTISKQRRLELVESLVTRPAVTTHDDRGTVL